MLISVMPDLGMAAWEMDRPRVLSALENVLVGIEKVFGRTLAGAYSHNRASREAILNNNSDQKRQALNRFMNKTHLLQKKSPTAHREAETAKAHRG